MVRVLASSSVNCGFELRSAQTKDYKNGICCFSAEQAERVKTSWLGIRIMCPSGAICLSAGCCFSEHYKNPTKRVEFYCIYSFVAYSTSIFVILLNIALQYL